MLQSRKQSENCVSNLLPSKSHSSRSASCLRSFTDLADHEATQKHQGSGGIVLIHFEFAIALKTDEKLERVATRSREIFDLLWVLGVRQRPLEKVSSRFQRVATRESAMRKN